MRYSSWYPGAWNYPLQLSLAPMLPAIAAGNCAIVKPRWQSQVNFIDNFIINDDIMDLLSEIAPATATAIAQLLPKYIDQVGFLPNKGAKQSSWQYIHANPWYPGVHQSCRRWSARDNCTAEGDFLVATFRLWQCWHMMHMIHSHTSNSPNSTYSKNHARAKPVSQFPRYLC